VAAGADAPLSRQSPRLPPRLRTGLPLRSQLLAAHRLPMRWKRAFLPLRCLPLRSLRSGCQLVLPLAPHRLPMRWKRAFLPQRCLPLRSLSSACRLVLPLAAHRLPMRWKRAFLPLRCLPLRSLRSGCQLVLPLAPHRQPMRWRWAANLLLGLQARPHSGASINGASATCSRWQRRITATSHHRTSACLQRLRAPSALRASPSGRITCRRSSWSGRMHGGLRQT
jgi:hypothetical protein